jgi:hypothetical protein
MMGTLATLMAGKKILTREDVYQADVEGDIENIGGILKISRIRVTYRLKAPHDLVSKAREAFANYIRFCPAAQSVIGCIDIQDNLEIEEIATYR